MTDLSGDGVRVLLVGTATHRGPTLSSVPAAGRSVTALEHLLKVRCGVRAERLRVIVDPPDALSMATAITDEARRAQTVFVFYFVGHGLLGPGGELYLAACGTDTLLPGLAAHQALPFSAIQEAIGACRADAVVVVLDCCFSSRAVVGGRRQEPTFTLPAAHGAYVLASAEQLALAPEGQEHTTFTGTVIELLEAGDPRGPRQLTLDDVYDYLFRTLRAAGAPLPRRQAGDRAGDLVITSNPAYRELADPQPPESVLTSSRCPYPGLSPFSVEDAEFFHGRSGLLKDLFEAAARSIAGSQPLLVVGASGAGKSSLLRAGLLAGLADGAPNLPGSAGWRSILLTPGEQPVATLTARLDPTGATNVDQMREDPTLAPDLVETLLARRGSDRLVVVVDQLEQLFTLCQDERDRKAFLRALTSIMDPPSDRANQALVAMALRADFYGHAAAHEELAIALRENQLLVGPMTLDELQEAIEKPAARVGLRLDDGLADLMLLELGATRLSGPEAGTLPLLAYALWATWQGGTGTRLTVAGYLASGGIAKAIETSANATYEILDPAGQDAVRRMLPRLVRVDDELSDTARSVKITDLHRGLPDPEAAETALHRMAEARLLTLDRDTVRISHEALLRAWPLLSQWIDADRNWLRTHQQLRVDAQVWQRTGQEPSGLYRGRRLASVLERAAESSHLDELEPAVAEFLELSSRQEGRAARLRTTVVVGLAVLLVLALTATGVAVYQARAASRETRVAVVNSLVSRAAALRDSEPATALRLGIAALDASPSPETRAALVRQLTDSRYAGEFHTPDAPRIYGIVISGDGRTVVAAVGSSPSPVWDISNRATPRQLSLLPHPKGKGWRTGDTEAIVASPDGRLVLDGNSIWDLRDPAKPVPTAWLKRRDSQNEIPTYAIAYNAPRRLGIVGGGTEGQLETRGKAVLWDLSEPTKPTRLGEMANHTGPVWTAALSPDGKTAITGSDARSAVLWDVTDAARPVRVAELPDHAGPVSTAVFSPDGDTVVTGSAAGSAHLWDVHDRHHPRRRATLTGHIGTVWSIAFSPDEHGLLTGATADSTAALWDISTLDQPRRVGVLTHGSPVSAVAYSPDGQTLFTGGTDGNTRMWNVQDPTQPVQIVAAPAQAEKFDTKGRLVVTNGWDYAERTGVEIWKMRNEASPRRTATLEGAHLGSLSADGTVLISEKSGYVSIWDISDPGRPTKAASMPGSYAGLSPDGTVLGTSGGFDQPDALLWDITNRNEPRRLGTIPVGGYGWASDISISPNNAVLVDPGTYESQLWDIRDKRRPRKLGTIPGTQVVFSHDSQLIMASSEDLKKSAVIWDLHDPQQPRRLRQLEGYIGGFSSDGHTAMTVGMKNTYMWDVTAPAQPQPLETIDGYTGLGFTEDGRVLYSRSHDGRLVLLDVGSFTAIVKDPIGRACAIVGHGLDSKEWSQYAPGLPYRDTCHR